MHFNGRNSRAWWLTRTEGQRRSWRSMPKETKPLGNFGTKIILSKLETLRIGYRWLHAPHFCKLPVPPKMQAPPSTSVFWLSAPLASYSTQFSPAPPLQKPFFIRNKIPFLLEPLTEPPSHRPPSLKPDLSPRRRCPWEPWGGQLCLPQPLWGPGSGGQFDRWKFAFPPCFA